MAKGQAACDAVILNKEGCSAYQLSVLRELLLNDAGAIQLVGFFDRIAPQPQYNFFFVVPEGIFFLFKRVQQKFVGTNREILTDERTSSEAKCLDLYLLCIPTNNCD